MASVSEAAQKIHQVEVIAQNGDIPPEQRAIILEQMTVMQGSIWEYSDSQPWFIAGLHKNNPTATRQALESIMKFHSSNEFNSFKKRRGTVSLADGAEAHTLIDSQGKKVNTSLQDRSTHSGSGDHGGAGNQNVTSTVEYELSAISRKRFSGPTEMKIVIKKTVELVSDMSKSCELVFHATRACARFLTYPTPSVPSDNFTFGHAKGWIWLIYKGLSHFNPDKTDKKELDAYLKIFRKEMSLLAKEANGCASDIKEYMENLKKLNVAIKKEAKLLRKHHKLWVLPTDHYFHFLDELKSKRNVLVDLEEDRFFPTDWIFEPHPSQTKFQWDFFHFQWVDLKRDWIDAEFEVRSDYSLHWASYSSFPPGHQTEIIVHLIQHFKALLEECHQFHKINMHLSFDYQEVKFLKFAVEEIIKVKRNKDTVDFITTITRKLFEDLAMLQKICDEYMTNLEWIVTIIEPCYRTMNRWLADDLILPLEFSARIRRNRRWFCGCNIVGRRKNFLEMFGDELHVVLLRSPISISQLERFFPSNERLKDDDIPAPCAINSFGISRGYTSSIFDTGLGREKPLPIHHPLPKFRKRHEQKINIFDINRMIETTVDCKIKSSNDKLLGDVDIEKYLVLVEDMQRFFAVHGTIFSFAMTDIKERVENLEALMYNNLPEHYESLDSMIMYEKSKQMENGEKSGTKAFMHLHRIFQFVVYFMERANALEDSEISYYACKTAYYKSYARLQSWIYQKSATFSMYSLPSKMELFNSLFGELEKTEMDVKVKEFVDEGYKLIDTSENVMKYHNLADIK